MKLYPSVYSVALFTLLLTFSCKKEEAVKQLPLLLSGTVTDITATTAKFAGEVSQDGGATVIARGTCWSTNQFPSISDSKTSDGSGIGGFTSSITGLTPSTTYFIRIYATNSVGTSYTEPLSFRTISTLSSISTTTITNITMASAISGGSISSDGGSPITARGICWSINQLPTITNGKTIDGAGTGAFTSSITGLYPLTKYYVRAYASNINGTAYGNELSLTTESNLSSFTDSRDGKTYKTAKIGNQWWMAENLAYLPMVSPPTEASETTPYYYVYSYSGTNVSSAKANSNFTTYGVLYNLPAALSACPSGWHLPSDSEWKQLEMALGMDQGSADAENLRGTDQGTQMKATSGWSGNGNGTNISGFTGLAGGYRLNVANVFMYIGVGGFWWSSTPNNQYTNAIWCRGLDSQSYISRFFSRTDMGLSVRCVKN